MDEPKEKRLERQAESLEEKGHSLLIVDLLKLRSKFSFKRYKIDLVGFLLAWLFVVAIILLTMFLARVGG